MIKVEHTKLHLANSLDSMHKLITDAKLVLVECKPEEAVFCRDYKAIKFYVGNKIPARTYLKPILISETEMIEKGDWVYDTLTKNLFQVHNTYTDTCVKVMALPEHFSQTTLQMIVDGKLKDGDKVLIECKHHIWNGNMVHPEIEDYYHIKLNPHITIYPVEEKMYTREEVVVLLTKFDKEYFEYTKKYGRSNLSTWLKLNGLNKM